MRPETRRVSSDDRSRPPSLDSCPAASCAPSRIAPLCPAGRPFNQKKWYRMPRLTTAPRFFPGLLLLSTAFYLTPLNTTFRHIIGPFSHLSSKKDTAVQNNLRRMLCEN